MLYIVRTGRLELNGLHIPGRGQPPSQAPGHVCPRHVYPSKKVSANRGYAVHIRYTHVRVS